MASLAQKRKQRRSLNSIKTNRILAALIILSICGLVLVGKLVYLTVFQATDQYAKQVDQLVDEVALKAERGNIYDRNNNMLVQDSSASAIHVIPYSVEQPDRVATVLSEKLGLKKDEVYQEITQIENEIIEIKRSVTQEQADEAMAAVPEGITYIDMILYATPSEVKSPSKAAASLAKILEMEEADVIEVLTRKKSNMVLVAGKVDNALAEEIKEELTFTTTEGEGDDAEEVTHSNGVRIVEDKRRYYTNGNFASHVLGFTGQDHNGLAGIEAEYEDTLRGEDGIVYYQKDAKGNQIPSQTKVVREPERGEDLVLSLDSNIQILAEKRLGEAVSQWQAKSGTCIVLDTKTGEVLAMATKPDYNLNSPYIMEESYAASNGIEADQPVTNDQLTAMWKNPAVSFIYEPGSTFKAITAASALEEGAVKPDDTVYCSGGITVGGVRVGCTGNHGTQTVREAVANSCNPGLVQIIQKLDPNVFYQYAYNFGFGEGTGIETIGEETGLVNRPFDENGEINALDYANFSFGQGIGTTPIQLVAGLNAVINNGYYMTPTLIKGGSKDSGDESPRQLISADTSKEMREIMEMVVSDSPNLQKIVGDYRVGGKTGTAEKFIDGAYSSTYYVTSFFCYAPVEDPRYSILMVLDEPDPSAFGGTSAAPYALNLMNQLLNYSGDNTTAESEIKQGNTLVPDLTGQTLEFAKGVLDQRGIPFVIENEGEGSVVIEQSLPAKTAYDGSEELVLYLGEPGEENAREVTVPDLTGMSIQAANEILLGQGLKIEIQGSGFAVNQSQAPGTKVEKGTSITVKFAP